MKRMIIAALMLTSAAPALAQSQSDTAIIDGMKICATVEQTQQRLTCFDVLAGSLTERKSVPPANAEKAWTLKSETSAIDDSKNVFLQVTGENGIENQYGQSASIVLTLACRENVTSAYFSFGGHFMSSLQGAGRVRYRIDSKPAQTKTFEESNNHEALGLWSGGSAIPWIKSLYGGSRMYIEATPYSENAVSDFLPIAGLEAAIKPLSEACRW